MNKKNVVLLALLFTENLCIHVLHASGPVIEKVKKDEHEKQREWALFESWAHEHCWHGRESSCWFGEDRATIKLLSDSDLAPGVYKWNGYPVFVLKQHGFSDEKKITTLINALCNYPSR